MESYPIQKKNKKKKKIDYLHDVYKSPGPVALKDVNLNNKNFQVLKTFLCFPKDPQISPKSLSIPSKQKKFDYLHEVYK